MVHILNTKGNGLHQQHNFRYTAIFKPFRDFVMQVEIFYLTFEKVVHIDNTNIQRFSSAA
jgi:hypothetical protein